MKKTALLLAILIFIVPFADAASMKKSVDVVLYPITFFFDGEEANTQKQGEFFNGKEYVPLAMIHKGTTYVPLRFVGEKLGKEVGWDPDTYSIWVGQKPEALGTAQTDGTENRVERTVRSVYRAECGGCEAAARRTGSSGFESPRL